MFWEVHEEVLGQCSAQGISAPKTEGLSAYQWSFPEERQEGCLIKYSTKVSRFFLEILEKSKVIRSESHFL